MKPLPTYEPHPLAEIFPLTTGKPLEELAASIKRSGLRDPIVLLDDKILDGRNRDAACQIAGVTAQYREFGSYAGDGTSPAHFVADRNLHHRHLTPAQASAAAEEFLPFFEQEGMTTTQARQAAATQFNVSVDSVAKAGALHKTDPVKFAEVKAGKTSLNAASKDAKAAQRDANREAAETDTTAIRKAHTKEIHKQLGEGFGVAFDNSVILKDPADLDEFLALHKDDRKLVAELIVRKWATKVALKFMQRTLDGDSKLKDLVLQTMSLPKPPKVIVDGYVITCRKAVEGAD